MPLSPTKAPTYTLYRTVTANDTPPIIDVNYGINMSNYKTANIQVVPSGGANPTVGVMFWSEEATKFVQASTAISKAGVGADTAHEFEVECNGRIIFVTVSSLSAGSVTILVSGFELHHPS